MRALLLVLVVSAGAGACSMQTPEPTPTITTTTTTTSEAPGADPVVWFEAYCGPMGVSSIASAELQGKVSQGMGPVKDSAVRWTSLAAVSDRKIADDIEKLGPMGSDARNPHDRLIKALRTEAGKFDEAAGRLRALAADEKFPERYEQVMATVSDGESTALFKQIVDIPKYGEVFRANKVCADWQALAKELGGS